MRKIVICSLSVFCLSCALATAEDTPLSGGELQQRADQILNAEPEAEKVTVRVEVAPQEAPPNTRSTNFMDFDLNKDGMLSRDEVGEKLFRIFDKDGNQVIDNIEMNKVGVLAYTPMQKKTVDIIDYHTGGTPQKVNVSEEDFLQASRLIAFDKNKDGLTPLDFLGMPFNQVNVKRDAVIDLEEWKRAYADSLRPIHYEQFKYNN